MQDELEIQARRLRDQNKTILQLKNDLNNSPRRVNFNDDDDVIEVEIVKNSAPSRRPSSFNELKMGKKALEGENTFLKDSAKDRIKQLDQLQKMNEDLKRVVKERETELTKKNDRLEKLKRQLLNAKEDALEKKVAKEKAMKNLELEKFQVRTLNEELEGLIGERDRLKNHFEKTKLENRKLKDLLMERENELRLKNKDVSFMEDERRKRKERLRLQEEANDLKSRELEQRAKNEKTLKVENYKLADRVDELERQLNGLKQENNQFKYLSENDLEHLKQEVDDRDRQITQLTEKVKKMANENDDLETDLYNRMNKLENAEENAKRAMAEADEAKKKIHTLLDKIESFKNQLDNIDTQESVNKTKIE